MSTLLSGDVWPALFTLGVLAAMFVAFVRELYPPEVTAICGAAALLATGVLPVDEMLAVFSNPAPITIAAMFIISGGLLRTGVLEALMRRFAADAAEHPRRVLFRFGALTALASAFLNNTPVVVMMIPAVLKLGRMLHVPASMLLIPLSYMAILGGMATLIGTSTNLLVDGIARAHGLAPFGLFEVTPLALVILAVAALFIVLAAPRLLPVRRSMADFLTRRQPIRYFTEVVIPEGSDLVGRKVLEAEAFRREGMTVVDVIRGDLSLRRRLGEVVLEPGDRVVLRTAVGELLSLRESNDAALAARVDPVEQKPTITVEALIMPGCRMIGRRLGDLRLRRRYGVYPLAIHRRDERVGPALDEVQLQVGDTLLLEGAPDDIHRLAEEQGLAELTEPSERPYRRDRAPLMLAVLALVVVGGAVGLMPIAALAVIGVAIALAARCIDAEEAFRLVEIRILALIFAMLAVGRALELTGALEIVVGSLVPWLEGLPPRLVIWIVFLLASVMTELVSNNAVAVIMTPIAISIAEALGVDPRPLVVTVMIAASASFATPIGYQTNTLVYAPGGYRFTDYMRLGIPLNLIVGLLSALLVPVLWPL